MKLIRLFMRDFRGVREREIQFAKAGVNLIAGPNESGKSSMITAILTVLREKHSTQRTQVKRLQPVGRDVGPEVELEFELGGYHLTLNKRYLRSPRTELRVSGAENRQLSGGEAHQYVEELLKEHLDWPLFEALLLMQSKASEPLQLVGMNSLESVLGAEDNSSALQDENEPLWAAIETEYAQFFTSKGSEKKDWAERKEKLKALEADVSRSEQELAQLEAELRDLHRDEELISQLEIRKGELHERWKACESKVSMMESEEKALGDARWKLRETEHQLERKRESLNRKRQVTREWKEARERVVETELQTQDHLERIGNLKSRIQETRLEREKAVETLGSLQNRLREVEAIKEGLLLRERKEQLERLWGQISESLSPIEPLAFKAPEESRVREIEAQWMELENLRARLRQVQPGFKLVAESRLHLTLGEGETPHELEPGEVLEASAEDVPSWSLPGTLRFEFTGAERDEVLRGKRERVQQAYTEALAEFRVESLAALRERLEAGTRWKLEEENRKRVLRSLLGNRRVEELQNELQQLTRQLEIVADEGPQGSLDGVPALEDLREEYSLFEESLKQKDQTLQGQIAELEILNVEQAQLNTTHEMLLERLAGLEEQRKEATQDQEDEEGEGEGEAQAALEAEMETRKSAVTAIESRMLALGGDRVRTELTLLEQSRKQLEQEVTELREKRIEKRVHLRAKGDLGLAEQLDEKKTQLFGLRKKMESEERRANAIQILRRALQDARDENRARYRAPFREKINELGRFTYSTDSFSVELGEQLQIEARILESQRIEWSSLSGGAQEQLDVITRVAAGLLVARESTVPVFLDETLVYSDPDRRWFLGSLLQWLGRETQVIVLTSDRGRFAGIVPESHLIQFETLA